MHKQNQHIERMARSLARTAIIRANKLSRKQRAQRVFKPLKIRVIAISFVVLVLLGELTPIFNVFVTQKAFAFQDPQSLLPQTTQAMSDKVKIDTKNQTYAFNGDYAPQTAESTKDGGAKIKATVNIDPAKGLSVTDPVSNLDFGLKPKFNLKTAERHDNRIVYALADQSGWLVYTMQAGEVKEDILLNHSTGNKLSYDYDLDMGDNLEARLQKDGSVGVYGSSLPLNGSVSTGSDKDAQLLMKARKAAKKDTLFFTIPAPVIKESNKAKSDVEAHYELNGTILTLKVSNLKNANYPLTIDPSVYVQSAQKLMRGNNESNVDFNVTGNLIQKGSVTGARIDDWVSDPNTLPTSLWRSGVAVAGGYIYVVGGATASANVATVYWAQLATDGTTNYVGTWNTSTSYNLPVARSGLSLTAYNGYLFAMGGQDSSCTSTTGSNGVCNTIYSIKLAASGEPITWNATAGTLNTERKFFGAAAYENRMYILGGQSGATTANAGVATSQYAEINPNGTIGTWTTTTALTASRYGMSTNIYNGYIYVLGGNSGVVTAINTVQYAKILPTGIGSWITTSAMSNGRQSMGGSFSTIWSGYMYVSAGCSKVNPSGYCTVINDDLQVASINADGSLTPWQTEVKTGTVSTTISQSNIGNTLIAWRNTLYSIGGCTVQDTTSGACTAVLNTAYSGVIKSGGFVGPTQSLSTIPTTLNTNGLMSTGVVINNGYIYSIGGCERTSNTGTTLQPCTAAANASTAILYAAINADGTLGAWTTATATIPAGRVAAGVATYNNTLYIVGGGTASGAGQTNIYAIPITSTGNINGTWVNNTAAASASNVAVTYPYVFTRTNPSTPSQGYLYMIGGCTTASGVGCSTGGYRTQVRRCAIGTTPTALSGCADITNMQLPNSGIGIFAGAVYGDYVYLAGGADGTGAAQTTTVYYAKVDSTGSLVNPSSGTTTGGWQLTSGNMQRQRRRASAYAVNGYLYVVGGHDGGSAPQETLADVQIGKINAQTGDIAAFTQVLTAISARWDYRGASANGNMYLVGGCSDGAPPDKCTAQGLDGATQSLQVYNNNNGSPALYTSTTANTTTRIGGSSVIYNGYIYNAGGCTNIGCTAFTNTVEYAPIAADGTIGTWATTSALTTNRNWFKLLASNGYMYALGGQSANAVSTALSTTEKTAINSSTGALNGWALDTTIGSTTVGSTAAITANSVSELDGSIYNGYIYATGGMNQAGTVQSVVYYALLNTSTGAIGAWATTTALPIARSGHTIITYNSTMYVLGGFDGTNYLQDVLYAKIGATGTTGTYSSTQQLPQPVRDGNGFAANGYLYLVAGRSGATTCTNNTYVASITANSTVANGNNPNGLGAWYQTTTLFGTATSSARYGASVAYDSGKAYILGGGCTALVTTNDRSYYSTMQSQPQVAKYSYMIDADTDVTPSKTLFNGIDNGIGANWILSYRSSTNSTAAWGLNTVFGKTTLGTPQAYIPIDSAGTNTNTSRYHFIYLTIDGSQAFGYPEDISRGPTITDMTFQFTSDPSKRLRNGKTFIGGEQQPLDAAF